MMVAEIVGGLWFGSVALVADGLHMSTHAGALLIAALAYTYSRRYARDNRFAFGTGKLGDLAAFTSAIALAMIALLIGYESLSRFFSPVPIAFNQAIPIAVVGLGVNLLSAFLLREDHDHDHPHPHDHSHHHHRDHNLRAAFVHVMADAAVSVLVIIGLVAGRQFGWIWMDPLMGIIATVVILSWSWSLVEPQVSCCWTFLLIKLSRRKLSSGSKRVATKFRTFIYGVLAPVTWLLLSQWYPIIQRLPAPIRSAFRTCRAFLTSRSRWSVALVSMSREKDFLSHPLHSVHVRFGSVADVDAVNAHVS